MNRNMKWLALAVVAGLLLVALFLRLQSVDSGSGHSETRKDADLHLERARAILRDSADLASCRNALQQLNSYLNHNPDIKLPTLSPSTREELRRQLALDERELAEIEHPSFTLLDGIHIELCLLLRDASRGLVLRSEKGNGQAPELEAAAALAWVTRHIQIDKPDFLLADSAKPEIVPQLLLRGGSESATALTRALLFAALVEQLGHDACLISFPVKVDEKARYWACGVLGSQAQIYLFDPRMGLPLPGPAGVGIATLAQASVKDSAVLRQLDLGPNQKYDVSPEQAAGAEVHLVPSLSALAPRMGFVEKEVLARSGGGHLLADLAAAERFAKSLKACGHSAPVKLAPWAVRLQWNFFPAEDGGVDRPREASGTGGRSKQDRFKNYLFDSHRKPLRDALLRVVSEKRLHELTESLFSPITPINNKLRDRFLDFYFLPGRPPDQLVRGQLSEAAQSLSSVQATLVEQRGFYRKNFKPEAIQGWIETVEEALAHLNRNREDVTARAALEAAERKYNDALHMLVDGTSAEAMLANIAYLCALTKHEQAERDYLRLAVADWNSDSIAEAERDWEEVRTFWREFLFQNPGSTPVAAARRLQVRVHHALAELALIRVTQIAPAHRLSAVLRAREAVQTALDLWQDLAGDQKNLMTLGFQLQARQLKYCADAILAE
jgi:hypothetical protein